MYRFRDLDHPPVRCQILSMTRLKEVPENGAGDCGMWGGFFVGSFLVRSPWWLMKPCTLEIVVKFGCGLIFWFSTIVKAPYVYIDMQFGSDMQFWCFSSKRFTVYYMGPHMHHPYMLPCIETVFHGMYWCMIHCLLNCARGVNPQYKWGSKNALLRENCGPHC